MAPECMRLVNRLGDLIAPKRKERFVDVIRFALLRSTLVALRGFRGKTKIAEQQLKDIISFTLIPELSIH